LRFQGKITQSKDHSERKYRSNSGTFRLLLISNTLYTSTLYYTRITSIIEFRSISLITKLFIDYSIEHKQHYSSLFSSDKPCYSFLLFSSHYFFVLRGKTKEKLALRPESSVPKNRAKLFRENEVNAAQCTGRLKCSVNLNRRMSHAILSVYIFSSCFPCGK
jgi:hypothetical protein